MKREVATRLNFLPRKGRRNAELVFKTNIRVSYERQWQNKNPGIRLKAYEHVLINQRKIRETAKELVLA